MSNTLFRKNSLDRISSPEQLNDYIKVSNPSIWMVLIALFVLLAVVFVWGITGSMPTSVTATGIAKAGQIVCYLDTSDAATVKAGQAVKIHISNQDKTAGGVVTSVGTFPLSASEIAKELNSDYLTKTLAKEGFAVRVVISVNDSDIADNTLLSLNIVTDEVRPIDFLLN